MISYFTSRHHSGPISEYLRGWGGDLSRSFRICLYEDLPDARELETGAAIFADVERATPANVSRGAALRRALDERGRVRSLNYPGLTLDRRGLLGVLHAAGVNGFRAFPPGRVPEDVRFPVFVRMSRDHRGPLTGLLRDRPELDAALSRLACTPMAADLLVVEFVDVGEDGLYRKYSAFRLGGDVIAHHVMFRRHWMVKGPSLSEPWMVKEEREFQLENPHADLLITVFEAAGVDYGRVDYGLAGGRVQVWEINTNPTILYRPDVYSEAQMPAKRWFSGRVNEAFTELA